MGLIMDKRFVKAYRDKWIDRGPVRTIMTRAGKKTGRFGLRCHKAMYKDERDRWDNLISTFKYWYPMVECEADPNKRDAKIMVYWMGPRPQAMTSDKYQSIGDLTA